MNVQKERKKIQELLTRVLKLYEVEKILFIDLLNFSSYM